MKIPSNKNHKYRLNKNHKNRYTTDRGKQLTSNPVCWRMDEELAKELKSVPDWQEGLRLVLPELIKNWKAR